MDKFSTSRSRTLPAGQGKVLPRISRNLRLPEISSFSGDNTSPQFVRFRIFPPHLPFPCLQEESFRLAFSQHHQGSFIAIDTTGGDIRPAFKAGKCPQCFEIGFLHHFSASWGSPACGAQGGRWNGCAFDQWENSARSPARRAVRNRRLFRLASAI